MSLASGLIPSEGCRVGIPPRVGVIRYERQARKIFYRLVVGDTVSDAALMDDDLIGSVGFGVVRGRGVQPDKNVQAAATSREPHGYDGRVSLEASPFGH